MGTGFHGGFGATTGAGLPKYPKDNDALIQTPREEKKHFKNRTIDDNADNMKKDYPLSPSGYFGEKGKNARIIKTSTPEATSTDFYNKLGEGGKTEPLANGHGTRTTLPDGSIIVHRLITSTPGSPAVDIKVIGNSKVKSQKIHFVRE